MSKETENPEEAPVGDGMAKKAIDTIKLHKEYQESVLAAAVVGEPHPDFEDWVNSKKEEK